jgi:serine/threonine protein phosphatase PrpC
MSTFCLKSTPRRGVECFVLSLVVVMVMAQQLVAPAVTFAANSSYQFGNSAALDKAGISVVRLVAAYTTASPVAGCPSNMTGLGVLVGSWATSQGSKDFSNWILTDGAFINPKGISCGAGKPTELLSSIQVYLNDAYTSGTPSHILKSLTCHATSCSDGPATEVIACQVQNTCEQGTVLLPIHTTAPEPFIDLAQVDQTTPSSFGIELAGSPTLPVSPGQAPQLLEPIQVPLGDPRSERGMPIVNSGGQLLDMNTKELQTGQSVREFVTRLLAPAPIKAQNTNTLQANWNQGIADYYAGDFTTAQSDFIRAGAANAQFQAPVTFLKLPQFGAIVTTPTPASPGKTAGAPGTPSSSASRSGPFAIPDAVFAWFPWIIGAALLLIAILVLVIVMVIRSQMRHSRELAAFEKERAAAEQKAVREVQRQQAQQAAVDARGPLDTVNSNAQPQANLRCPNCGYAVLASDIICAQCRSPLALSDSGLNVRLAKPQVPAQVPVSTSQAQPTLTPSSTIYDQPTRAMTPGELSSGSEDLDKTQPYTAEEMAMNMPVSVERYVGPNMSLVVGTRSNPGIKRQHKPNEDSLFAAQGERVHNSYTQQFGLFVVADGMGGHANGQDASRLAIQTISDEVLPKISGSEPLNDDTLAQILVDGVQHANHAVHQRNMEQRADMGTTITAALIVGATAYVANVGDSRTYLYRKSTGLQKITNDHSVVASLVEAGIIQPDDIYTHPKRNQIYRSLGEKPVVDVDWFKVSLLPEDKLLLCSDGLWDMVRDPAIGQILNAVPDPSQTGNALIKAALEGGGEDNVSVIVVHITEATQRTGITGVQLLARPEAPQWPPL